MTLLLGNLYPVLQPDFIALQELMLKYEMESTEAVAPSGFVNPETLKHQSLPASQQQVPRALKGVEPTMYDLEQWPEICAAARRPAAVFADDGTH
ncbi:hypothetical protein CEUSTIGMA_g11546.t1 [Chlamydomonas eustigma]|uniref:Uncharacterized protein n=1 Tax=Chlamydomonas eustigma TaxID=1157962 RepID=A0A250XM71_9CHLO|nr:hypothetical protein CEUSTIGMA_g11546.t1 [Chlamydomonas eustigma]|eukprot:GAX84123.1 hypothetical protein CEUSTIGMA_g11546.t1 [Chlamydomonas eustigma]